MKSKKLISILLTLAFTFSLTTGFTTKATKTAVKPNVLTVISQMTNGWVQNFNPYVNNALHASLGFVFEPLVIFNTYQNNKETPWLAEKITSLPDNKTIMIYVRKGVKWSDGVEFTAKDVAFTYNYNKNHPAIDTNGDWKHGTGAAGRLASVTVVDKYTVKMVLNKANRFARSSIFNQRWMVPEHIFAKVAKPESYIMKTPVGTGAFTKVKSFKPEMMVIDRNPTFWNGKSLKVDEVRWPQCNTNEAAISLMSTGAVDWAHIFVADAEKNYVKGHADRKFWYGRNDGVRLALNFMDDNKDTLKAFNDVNFRRAMSLCVDRQGINDSAVYGYLSKEVPTNTGLPPALMGYSDKAAQAEMAKYTKFDIAAAKKLLATAGYKDTDNDGFVENPDGSKVAFNITSPAGWTDWNAGASIAAEGLQKAGIDATAKAIDLAIYVDSWKNNDHDVMYGGYGLSADPYQFYFNTIGNQASIHSNLWWSVAMTNLANDEMTALIDKMPLAKDAELKASTSKIEQYFANNMINIPIFFNGNWFNYTTTHFTGWATASNPFCNPANVNHDGKLLQLMSLKPVTK